MSADELLGPLSRTTLSDDAPRSTARRVFDGRSGEFGGVSEASSSDHGDDDEPKYGILLFDNARQDDVICLGCIGSSAERFCIRICESGESHCGTKSHGTKKFSVEKAGGIYIKSTESQAFCEPVLPLIDVPDDDLQIYTSDAQKSFSDWKEVFERSLRRMEMDRDLLRAEGEKGPKRLILQTPARPFGGKPVAFDEDQFFESVSDTSWDQMSGDTSTKLVQQVKSLDGKLKNIQEVVLNWRTEVEARLSMAIGDFEAIREHCDSQARSIGQPRLIKTRPFGDLWSAVQFLSTSTETSHLMKELPRLIKDNILMKESLHLADEKNSQMGRHQKQHEDRWIKLLNLLPDLRRSAIQVGDVDVLDLARRVAELEDDRSFGTQQGEAIPMQVVQGEIKEVARTISRLEYSISELQDRSNSRSVSIGSYHFGSIADLKGWIIKHLPRHEFGLFVDGVSIFEFFFGEHINPDKIVQSMYTSKKTGMRTMYEARVAASFQNVLPTILGKANAATDTNPYLPGLSKPERWDNGDGYNGLKYQVMRETVHVKTEIASVIRDRLHDDTEALQLAMECLHASLGFINGLSLFISQQNAEFVTAGRYQKLEVWFLISRCVRRVYGDISEVRVTARDVHNPDDALGTATQYLWATLKSHGVMQEFVRRNFIDHPSTASIITRFLVTNAPAAQARVEVTKPLEDKVKSLKESISKLTSRVSSLESSRSN